MANRGAYRLPDRERAGGCARATARARAEGLAGRRTPDRQRVVSLLQTQRASKLAHQQDRMIWPGRWGALPPWRRRPSRDALERRGGSSGSFLSRPTKAPSRAFTVFPRARSIRPRQYIAALQHREASISDKYLPGVRMGDPGYRLLWPSACRLQESGMRPGVAIANYWLWERQTGTEAIMRIREKYGAAIPSTVSGSSTSRSRPAQRSA